jgi:hypothetical protein
MIVPPSTMTWPRMAEFTAEGEEVPLDPEGPVGPERPVSVSGPARDPLVAAPVRPVLVEEEAAFETPELPELASGEAERTDVPPEPPPAVDVPTLEPPVAATRPEGDSRATRFSTGAPPSETGRATPPGPPDPPVEAARMPLAATPVSPDLALALEAAPLLAEELAPPAARAAPVGPEAPVLPVATVPPTAVALPRMAVLVAVGDEVAEPVPPVAPEPPDWAAGWAAAVEAAGPVSPVFVLPDWALDAPELPLVAVGLMVTVEPPPLPPLAVPVATPLPPVPDTSWAEAGRTAPTTEAAASAKANATSARRRAVTDLPGSAEVLEYIVTLTSLPAIGEAMQPGHPNKPDA